MLIAQGLETGMYLVGREDGAIDPFFVQVLDNGAMKCHEDLEPLMDHAQDHAGWWWSRIGVPDFLPDSKTLGRLPDIRKERGS